MQRVGFFNFWSTDFKEVTALPNRSAKEHASYKEVSEIITLKLH